LTSINARVSGLYHVGNMRLKVLTNQTQSFFVYPTGSMRWGRIALFILGVVLLSSLLNRGSGPNGSSSALKLQTQESTPSPSATLNAPSEGGFVLSCQSIELYDRFAGDFDRLFTHPDGNLSSQEFQDNFGPGKKCELFVDVSAPATKLYHVEKIEPGYLCVRKVNEPQCRWTDASKLRYIGHGPQLSDAQFAQVEQLFAHADALHEVVKDYDKRWENIIFDGEFLRRLDPDQRREADELDKLRIKAASQAYDLQQQALKIGDE
jgi:hypothetical protein